MGLKNYYTEMRAVRAQMYDATRDAAMQPGLGESMAAFWRRTVFSVKLIFLEKELITFAVLQWLCIAAGYYLWIQMLGWIPEEAWRQAAHSRGATPGDLILFAWSFVVVGLVAFPLGILSACMGAVHFLNRQGKESTIVECLKMVMPRAWPLWIFHWIDGWWTVMRILDRLPKKNSHTSAAQRALSEAVYYAWKIATIGILPGLVTGRGLVDAGKRSIGVVRNRLQDVILLRAGYSALCWIVGIGAYIGTIFFFRSFPDLVNWAAPVESQIYKFYFWVAVPMLSAVGIVVLFLRPIYIISSCDIYADYVHAQGENLMLPPPPPGSRKGDTAFAAAVLLAAAILLFMFLRDRLGLPALFLK